MDGDNQFVIREAKLTLVRTYCRERALPFYDYTTPREFVHCTTTFQSKIVCEKFRMADVYLAQVSNVTVFGNGMLITDDNALFARGLNYTNVDKEVNRALEPYLLAPPDQDRYTLRIPQPTQEITEEVILLWGLENFGHWIYQYLTRLAVLDYQPQLKKLKILVREELTPRHLSMLHLLGFTPEQICLAKNPVYCHKVWIPSYVCYRGHYRDRSVYVWPDALHFLRSHFLKARETGKLASTCSKRRRLYFSRQTAQWRRIANEDNLQVLLAEYGFETIELSKLSVEEQIEKIRHAEIILTPIGADSIMTMFAPRYSHVIELSVKEADGVWTRIWPLMLNQAYYRMECEKNLLPDCQPKVAFTNFDMTIDLNLLKQILDDINSQVKLSSDWSQEMDTVYPIDN